MIENLKIYEKMYEFILWMNHAIIKFPKQQRFVLGQRIENITLGILSTIIITNQEFDKTKGIKSISIQLDILRTYIRLAKDFKILSIRQYMFACEKLNEIGKMLGGWMKVTKVGSS